MSPVFASGLREVEFSQNGRTKFLPLARNWERAMFTQLWTGYLGESLGSGSHWHIVRRSPAGAEEAELMVL